MRTERERNPVYRTREPARGRGLRGFGLVAAVLALSFPAGDGVPPLRSAAGAVGSAVMHAPSTPPSTLTKPQVRAALTPPAVPGISAVLRELATEDERSVADLAALLDADSSVRRGAAQLLAEMGTPSAVAALLNAIAKAPQGQPPGDLLAALDSLANPEAAPALSAFLLQAREPAVAAPVRDALARLADAAGVLEIVTALHESVAERWQQANLEGALLNVRSPAAVPILREVLLRDSNPVLRGQAALVLGYIGGAESAEALAHALATSRSSALTAAVTESLALLNDRAAGISSRPP